MPTILREDGFAVRVYSNDHPPPHVHCVDPNGEVRVQIAPIIEILSIEGRLSNARVGKAVTIVQRHHDDLMKAWNQRHG